jgi:hypothetical protein
MGTKKISDNLPSPPLSLPKYVHFGTPGFFVNNHHIDFRTSTPCPNEKQSNFLNFEQEVKNGGVRVFQDGYWRWKRAALVAEIEAPVPYAIEEADEPQQPTKSNVELAKPVEAAKPLREAMDIVDSPPEVVRRPPPIATPTIVIMPTGPIQVAPQPQPAAIVPNPQVQAPPSPEEELADVLFEMASRSGELEGAMEQFCVRIFTHGSGYEVAGNTIHFLINSAQSGLKKFLERGMASQASSSEWCQIIRNFWTFIEPQGDLFVQCKDQGVLTLLEMILVFGNELGLNLQSPQITPPPPPPMPQMPPAPPMQQQFVAGTNMDNVHAPLKPTPSAPQVAPKDVGPRFQMPVTPSGKTPALVPQQSKAPPFLFGAQKSTPRERPAPPVKNTIPAPTDASTSQPTFCVTQNTTGTFDDLVGFWSGLKEEDLEKLNRQSFGWANDKATNRWLWAFSAAQDLEIKLPQTHWHDAGAVTLELKARASAFKRATIVLREQASAGKCRDHDLEIPVLLGDVIKFLQTAALMTRKCGGIDTDNDKSTWWQACIFFSNSFCADTKVGKKLIKQYGDERWELFQSLWDANWRSWLGDLEEI